MVVLGVSRDDQTAHQAFTQKYNLPFPLLVDTDGAISKAYDADGGGYSQRVTYVIDPQGQIARVYTSVKTDSHAQDILADLGLG
ncbi:anti-oxidant AhpCTSA family protein [Gloeomargarita lithophora Alchichica-D10]|uniref:Bacterioferritin comigratory protein n=1 Tax=Gloeomargarita lithophora Alchichica-D10 TaxID=1188229 RepID=A0A1J0AH58_9CYAN|nr:anti-oxidant AhpCTSA family protein [Gloeomargarita lithophora Alchichica-D10]